VSSLLATVGAYSRNKVSGTIFNFPDLYLIRKLNYERYYKALIRRKLSLFIDKDNRLVYRDIRTATE